MKTKHTPGVWGATGHDGKNCVIIESDKWGSIAKTLPIGCISQESANAQLIAQAPEMLSALLEIVGIYEDSEKNNGLAELLARIASKAISKAVTN